MPKQKKNCRNCKHYIPFEEVLVNLSYNGICNHPEIDEMILDSDGNAMVVNENFGCILFEDG